MEFLNNEDAERAEVYKLFSALFMEAPTEETVFQAGEMFGMKFDDLPREIKADFANLFLRPDLHVSPHESLYNFPLGEKPRLWGPATEEVRSFYRSAGLMIDEESEVIPDHLGAELIFMSYLIENGLVEQQKRFMEEHLFRWAPEYCEEVGKHAATRFYAQIADLLIGFLKSEQELLAE